MEWGKYPEIESDPENHGGAWVFTGTRVPVSALFGNLAAGATIEEFLNWFHGVEKRQVNAVLEHVAEDLDAKTDKLTEALRELQEAKANAEEYDLETPSDTTVNAADRLLKAMYDISPRKYTVYPDYDACLCIESRGPASNMVLMICYADGTAICLASIENKPRRDDIPHDPQSTRRLHPPSPARSWRRTSTMTEPSRGATAMLWRALSAFLA